MNILTFFVNFWLNQIQSCSVQIKKMKDRIFTFQLKNKLLNLNDARLKNVLPPLDLTRILKSYHKRNDRRKIGATDTTIIAQLDWSKTAKHFSVNSRGKFLSWHETRMQAGKQASGFLFSDRYFSFFWVVISTIYVVLFILGKSLLDSYQLFFIFAAACSTTFVYHGKTFRWHVSFSIS